MEDEERARVIARAGLLGYLKRALLCEASFADDDIEMMKYWEELLHSDRRYSDTCRILAYAQAKNEHKPENVVATIIYQISNIGPCNRKAQKRFQRRLKSGLQFDRLLKDLREHCIGYFLYKLPGVCLTRADIKKLMGKEINLDRMGKELEEIEARVKEEGIVSGG